MATTVSGTESSFGISGAGGRSSSDNTESKVITQVENEVSAELRKVHDVDIIELELPRIKAEGKKRDKIFETIHNVFNAEIVDNKLFIKLNGLVKSEIHSKVKNSLDQQLPPTWLTAIDAICVVNSNHYRPDVGGWNPKPALNQRIKPIINQCPPPLLWIEVAYDNSGDRDNAINKFTRVQPHCPTTEFVIVIVPATETAFPANSNPGVGSVAATPKTACPSRAPYLGHLSAGNIITAIQWYKMKWNRHLVLGCGANIDFNDILEVFT
ncbi:12041_t:CDS:2 [Cetraspora pellucida]|uniref:12041_t:CDS:1 n=1 Tax=Cetraspora pellucida TaxID=1433469 RepID=A0ACA9KQV9_9GLOM|nr:12041_t:CDS:2 [Cetraspora pellucida]